MTPELILQNYFFEVLTEQGFDVYDYLPDESASYPFILISNSQNITEATKTSTGGNVVLTIDVWGSKEQRYKVAQVTEEVSNLFKGRKQIESYIFDRMLNLDNRAYTVDNSSNQIFLHSQLQLNYKFY
ncbi:hypothetical protein R4Y45_06080 [Holzapfeliella sp. He02]|uniref:DUF3168 domain-containing protein n=1 Tax=Holzapfeliella saturejae TaxID=3082953 RepID=A0ABU8SHG3_9LACO